MKKSSKKEGNLMRSYDDEFDDNDDFFPSLATQVPRKSKKTANQDYTYGVVCHTEPVQKVEAMLIEEFGDRLEPIRAPLSERQHCKVRQSSVSPVNNLNYYGKLRR